MLTGYLDGTEADYNYPCTVKIDNLDIRVEYVVQGVRVCYAGSTMRENYYESSLFDV